MAKKQAATKSPAATKKSPAKKSSARKSPAKKTSASAAPGAKDDSDAKTIGGAKTKAAKTKAPKAKAPKAKAPKAKATADKPATTKPKTAPAAKKKGAAKTPAAAKAAKKAPGAPSKTKPKKDTPPSTGPAPANKETKAPSKPKPKAKPAYPKSSSFVRSQHQKLLELRDSLFDAVQGATRENLRNRSDGNDTSAFGMHQADAGSEAYDRDFALNMLNQEQDALYEINEAIQRIERNVYGVCEVSGEAIPKERLQYVPWARHTVQVQSRIEQEQGHGRVPRHSRSSFGFGEEEED